MRNFKVFLCIFLLILSSVSIVGAAIFETENETFVSSEFLSHTVSYEYVGSATASTYYLFVNNIQYWSGTKPDVLLVLADYGIWTVSNTSISSGTTDITFKISTNTITTGTINYNLLYDGEGNPSQMNVWIEFTDDFNIYSYTGSQSLTFSFTSGDINGLSVYTNKRADELTSSITEDYAIVWMVHSATGSNYIYPGDYILNEDHYWKNFISIIPNDGEDPYKFSVYYDRYDDYVSQVEIYTSTINYISDYSTNNIETEIYQYPIYLDVQDSSGTWYNRTYYGTETDTYFSFSTDTTEAVLYEYVNSSLTVETGAPDFNVISYHTEYDYDGGIMADNIYYTYINSTHWQKCYLNETTGTSTYVGDVTTAEALQYDVEMLYTGNVSIVCVVSDTRISGSGNTVYYAVNDLTVSGSSNYGAFKVYIYDVETDYLISTSRLTIDSVVFSSEIYNDTSWSGIYLSDFYMRGVPYTITVTADDYQTQTKTNQYLLSSGYTEIYFYLYPNIEDVYLKFTVTDNNDEPLNYVYISLSDGQNGYTSSKGIKTFYVSDNTTYTYRVYLQGYEEVDGSIYIDGFTELNIHLSSSVTVTSTVTTVNVTEEENETGLIHQIKLCFVAYGSDWEEANYLTALFIIIAGALIIGTAFKKSAALAGVLIGGMAGFIIDIMLDLLPDWTIFPAFAVCLIAIIFLKK